MGVLHVPLLVVHVKVHIHRSFHSRGGVQDVGAARDVDGGSRPRPGVAVLQVRLAVDGGSQGAAIHWGNPQVVGRGADNVEETKKTVTHRHPNVSTGR